MKLIEPGLLPTTPGERSNIRRCAHAYFSSRGSPANGTKHVSPRTNEFDASKSHFFYKLYDTCCCGTVSLWREHRRKDTWDDLRSKARLFLRQPVKEDFLSHGADPPAVAIHFCFSESPSVFMTAHLVTFWNKRLGLHKIKVNNSAFLAFRYITPPQTIQFVVPGMKQLSRSAGVCLSCWCVMPGWATVLHLRELAVIGSDGERWLWQCEHAFFWFTTVISAFKIELGFGGKAQIPFRWVHKVRRTASPSTEHVLMTSDSSAWREREREREVHDHIYWSACPKP